LYSLTLNKNKRAEIFQKLKAQNPEPATELNYSNPFELLIAVVLSAQATDVGVNNSVRWLALDFEPLISEIFLRVYFYSR